MNIFVDKSGRPRAGWRIVLQLILFLLFSSLMLNASDLLIDDSLRMYRAVAMGIAGVASVWFAAIVIDRRKLADYGIGWNVVWKKELGWGLLFGFLAISLIFGVGLMGGWVEITGYGWDRSADIPYFLWIANYLVAMLIIGYYEELIFRGYQILNMVEGFQQPNKSLLPAGAYALLISSAIFGIMHGANPNASWISTLNIILAGIILAIPYLLTGRLAISIGLHIAWNFALGGIFGFPVSGVPFRGSLLQIEQLGSTMITGGTFGPEAGILGIFGMLVMLALTILYLQQSGQLNGIHPNFRRPPANFNKTDEQG